MRKFLKLFVILIVSLMVMVACGNDDTSTKNNGNENIDSTSETDQTENNDADVDQEDVENDSSDPSNSETDDEIPVLALGETGVIEDTLGIYEVTPRSLKITESLGEGDEVVIAGNGRFVVVEIEIKNIGTEALDLQQITQADLFTETGSASAGFSDYPGLIEFVGEINSNESFVGELAFDNSERDYYELAFGAHMPSHISNEIRWVINPEDAE